MTKPSPTPLDRDPDLTPARHARRLALVSRGLALGAAALAAIALASGCATGEPGEPSAAAGDGAAASTDDEIRSSCDNPRLYFAALSPYAPAGETPATCEVVVAGRGSWVPEPLFPDAPPEVAASSCAYRWVAPPYTRADGSALREALPVGRVFLAPACGNGRAPGVGSGIEIPAFEVPDSNGMAGSVGCDVCGVQRNGRLWAVLPPTVNHRSMKLRLNNGEVVGFQIDAADTRALSIELPPPPAGTTYEPGVVAIY